MLHELDGLERAVLVAHRAVFVVLPGDALLAVHDGDTDGHPLLLGGGDRPQRARRAYLRTLHAVVEAILLLDGIAAPELEDRREKSVDAAFADVGLDELVGARLHAVAAARAERVYPLQVRARRTDHLASVRPEYALGRDAGDGGRNGGEQRASRHRRFHRARRLLLLFAAVEHAGELRHGFLKPAERTEPVAPYVRNEHG